jgi:hypothetical protein
MRPASAMPRQLLGRPSISQHPNRDPPQGARPSLHHDPPRGDAHGLRPSALGSVGGSERRARSAPLRVGATLGSAAPLRGRAGSGLDSRRDRDVSVPYGGWSCHGCRSSAEWSRSARRVCRRSGGGGGPRRRTRARCCGLRDQGGACRGPRTRRRERRPARMSLATQTAASSDSRTRPG